MQIEAQEVELVVHARAGDATAFGALVTLHHPAARRVATVVLGTSEGADDVVQQAMERAWRSLATFHADRAFGPWFLRIVANCARNDRRSRGRRGRLQVRVAAARGAVVVSPDEATIADEDRRRVVSALNRLSRDDRLVIALRHFEEMSERETAETLDCRAGTVKSRLSRAMGGSERSSSERKTKMTDRISGARLDTVLASVGRHLVVPDGSAPLAMLGPMPARRSPSRVLALAAAALVVVVLAVGALVAPVREAVADWLGIGTTRIVEVPDSVGDPAGLPELRADARPVTAAEAAAALGRELPDVTDPDLGAPTLIAIPPEGGVLMAWPRGATSLWSIRDDGSGAPFVEKLLSADDSAEPVADLGDGAVLIEGGHVLQTPARRLAAGRVLLWVEDGLQHRLESDLSRARMLEIARSIETRE